MIQNIVLNRKGFWKADSKRHAYRKLEHQRPVASSVTEHWQSSQRAWASPDAHSIGRTVDGHSTYRRNGQPCVADSTHYLVLGSSPRAKTELSEAGADDVRNG